MSTIAFVNSKFFVIVDQNVYKAKKCKWFVTVRFHFKVERNFSLEIKIFEKKIKMLRYTLNLCGIECKINSDVVLMFKRCLCKFEKDVE